MKPLCVDLFCGLGGWTEGFLAEGWHCIGFDIERHVYGEHRYPAQLVLADVRTLHGGQFKDAACILASSPCEEFSYRAMPWHTLYGKPRAEVGPPLLGMELFAQAARIQAEAIGAAGHHIPMIQENVRGAQKYVGRAQWHYGSYYLWGDVPAVMPIPHRAVKLGGGASWKPPDDPRHVAGLDFTRLAGIAVERERAPHQERALLADEGLKCGGDWFGHGVKSTMRQHGSKSNARKAASAAIAKIPFPLASHIARAFLPAGTRHS